MFDRKKKMLRILLASSLMGFAFNLSPLATAGDQLWPSPGFGQGAFIKVAGWGKNAPKVRQDFNNAANPSPKRPSGRADPPPSNNAPASGPKPPSLQPTPMKPPGPR